MKTTTPTLLTRVLRRATGITRLLLIGSLTTASALASNFSTTFAEPTLPAQINLDVPNPGLASVTLDTTNQELDFNAFGNTDMWGTRNNAPFAWVAAPTGLANGATWTVQTRVRINNTNEFGQLAGLTFYGGPNGAVPLFHFTLDNWSFDFDRSFLDGFSTVVRVQGIGTNNPNYGINTSAGAVTLRVDVTENGSSDIYNFYFRVNDTDPWTHLSGLTNFQSTAANSRVAMMYKTSTARSGVAFTDFSVTGPASNTAPTANAQSVTTNEDAAANITLTGSDPDAGTTLTYSIVTTPTNGILTGSGASRIYTPNTNFYGNDSFTFKVNDGTDDSAVATVSLTVDPVNDAPSFTLPPQVQVGVNWVQQTSPTLQWTASAASNDGMKLVAAAWPGNIYTSADRGVTWIQRASSQNWAGLASSADGTKLVAASTSPGMLYTSSDSGVTWTARPGAGTRDWGRVASSADGTKLVAGVWNGEIFTSTDSGETWIARSSAGVRYWGHIASSADGTKLAAVSSGGKIYISSDSGATWTARENDRNWFPITMSADGTKLAAGILGGTGAIYLSTDSGATWTPSNSGNHDFRAINSSADGTKLTAIEGVNGGRVYISYDSGVNWAVAPNSPIGYGETITISGDGSTIVFPAHHGSGGKIYTSVGSSGIVSTDTNLRTIANFATNISAGPANESSQVVSFNVTTDNNAMFSTLPAISGTGTLTFATSAVGTATITVVAQDDGGTDNQGVNTSAAQTFTITVSNSAPTDIALSANSIAENNAPGATIGTLSATDPDVADTHTFEFAGGADDGAFTITGNTLSINDSADFETKSSYSIRIRATDNGAVNLTFEKNFTVTINDVLEASGPLAVDDAVTTTTGETRIYPLANDGDPNVTILSVSDGSIIIDGRSLIIPEGYTGTFTYMTSRGRTASVMVVAGTPLVAPTAWTGLLYAANGDIAGHVNLTKTATGICTAVLKVGAQSKSVRFMLNSTGEGTATIELGELTATQEAVTGRMTFSLVSGGDTLSGSLRPAKRTATAEQQNIALGSVDAAVPGGGYVRAFVKGDGVIVVAGVLPDGRPFTHKTRLSDNGSFAIYTVVSKTQTTGIVGGEFTTANLTSTDVTGELAWAMGAQPSGLHAGGVNTTLTANGCIYTPAATLPAGAVTLTASGGNLAAPLVVATTATDGLPLASVAFPNWKVSVSRAVRTGLFGAKVKDPARARVVTGGGVYLPKSNSAWGYFPGTSEGGRIQLTQP